MLPAMDLYYGKQLRSFFPYLCRHFHTPPWAVLESPGTTAAMWRIYHQVPGRPRCLLAFPLSGIRAVAIVFRIPSRLFRGLSVTSPTSCVNALIRFLRARS